MGGPSAARGGPPIVPQMVPGGPFTVPWTVRGDHLFCHGRSGGTDFGGDHLRCDRTRRHFAPGGKILRGSTGNFSPGAKFPDDPPENSHLGSEIGHNTPMTHWGILHQAIKFPAPMIHS